MASSTVENYLKQVYLEERGSGRHMVPMGRLAALMNVVPGTATAMTDCSLMRITRTRFQNELEAVSPFMRNWVESLTDQLVTLLDHLRETV